MNGPPAAHRLRVLTLVGTRPEVIRLSRTLPLLDELFEHVLVHTGQNFDYELNRIFFEQLSLREPDHNLGVTNASLGAALGEVLIKLEPVLLESKPEAFLVLGDTNSSIGAVLARRLNIPVYHMEAGNRCFDANVPEEVNRRLVDHVADFNLVYTEHARRNLLSEGLPTQRIFLTGSPMPEVLAHYQPLISRSDVLPRLGLKSKEYIAASLHRQENVDLPERLNESLATLTAVQRHFGKRVLVSTHPRTRSRLLAIEYGGRPEIELCPPFGFLDYVQLQQHAFCVLSDSGTVAEESAILGFPAITLRESIERPEALEVGSIIQTGLNPDVAIAAIEQVLRRDPSAREHLPDAYQSTNFSQRVAAIVRDTAHVHHQWAGLRSRVPSPQSPSVQALSCS